MNTIYVAYLRRSVYALIIFCGVSAGLLSIPLPAVAATNLITNPGFETASGANPAGWIRGRWGTNTASFSYPAAGVSGSRAAQVSLTAHTTGDAKWAHAPVAVTAGSTYTYAGTYQANVPTYVTVEYVHANGTRSYVDLGTPGAAGSWQDVQFSFVVPSGVVEARIFHLINRVGVLTVDNVQLMDVTPSSSNRIGNPSFATTDVNGQPASWIRGRWGTNTAAFAYPVEGHDSTPAAQVQLTAHTTGDAKWAHEPVPVTEGEAYEFSNWYHADVPTYVTVEFSSPSGRTYLDLGEAPASAEWRQFDASFTVPLDVTAVSIFHVINRVGTLTVDQYVLRERAVDPTKFDQGYVSIHFDDGHRSVYTNAIPILEEANFASDQFITTEYVLQNFPGYVTTAQVRDMEAKGHLIGAHTRTHANLTQLTAAQAEAEIAGSRSDLLAMGVSPVDYFAYPFGAYNTAVQNIVRTADFSAARSSNGGYNDKTVDQFALRRQSMTSAITFADVREMIDHARMEKTWVILLFHEVEANGHTYAVTPALFAQIVDYLTAEGITPITMDEGIALMRE